MLRVKIKERRLWITSSYVGLRPKNDGRWGVEINPKPQNLFAVSSFEVVNHIFRKPRGFVHSAGITSLCGKFVCWLIPFYSKGNPQEHHLTQSMIWDEIYNLVSFTTTETTHGRDGTHREKYDKIYFQSPSDSQNQERLHKSTSLHIKFRNSSVYANRHTLVTLTSNRLCRSTAEHRH